MSNPFKIPEKVLSFNDYPRYVQMGMYRHFLYLFLLVGCTVAAGISFRSILVFLMGLVITLGYAFVVVHLSFTLSRDKALVLDGECIDFTESNLPSIRKTKRYDKAIIQSTMPGNDRLYLVPLSKLKKCTVGNKVSLYTLPNGIYEDSDGYVVIPSPIFYKTSR